ncbi:MULTISPECIES: NYN domain-containing protein [Brevibacillus]|jgi:predicted RNA-binding protein with PIN domain|uniref:NYN domain-containing protein n=1 Tax=Brevibacillus parabrevis TaxID=54914 RepID=A0A4Y3PWI3_BREPA|nr:MULTISPECIES: NYN domain-containing protein [Brevibacillus]TGV30126.1 NYN domain-containing protein [Mesorhizobium sp. M00.F.Ca.ET.186.01.1.1]MBU8716228.1 NYN domain-containing protein [Brevibacillus parabrevis]MDH6353398.1 putative RNA-binding protein with PIN domain [Brevibacillus sp. 1238]MDR5001472.1 NYN domain-containing protein [Brevibacillus parabrevis]MED1721407.1 NYN domain-containing protein [Brevibacillus parabrevis]
MAKRKAKQLLIVDGYNIIGAWPELRVLKDQERMAEARDLLISQMAEYQSYTGTKVIIVFDAYNVPGIGRQMEDFLVEIYFTKKKETADEKIEQLVSEFNQKNRQIYVATSDYTSQRVIFGQGALRKSARELLLDMENAGKEIKQQVQKTHEERFSKRVVLNDEIAKIFEKWRRE